MINAAIVTRLMQTLLIEVPQVSSSYFEIGLNLLLHSRALRCSQRAVSLIIFVEAFRNEEIVSQRLYSKRSEIVHRLAFFGESAGIEQQNAANVHLEPCWCAGIAVMFKDIEGKFGDNDACISHACQIHSLILQFRELLIESKQSSEVFVLGYIVVYLCLDSNRVSHSSRPLDKEHVGHFVPVVGVKPKVRCISGESELPLRVEPAVE